MKTIEEAAKEYAIETNGTEDEWAPDRMASRTDFKAGAKFAQRWIPVEEELPLALNKVFVKILNSHNKEFVTTAQYVPQKTVLAEDFLDPDYSDSDLEDYDEEKDVFYVIPGWWENSYEADVNYMISDKITHWRPIELK